MCRGAISAVRWARSSVTIFRKTACRETNWQLWEVGQKRQRSHTWKTRGRLFASSHILLRRETDHHREYLLEDHYTRNWTPPQIITTRVAWWTKHTYRTACFDRGDLRLLGLIPWFLPDTTLGVQTKKIICEGTALSQNRVFLAVGSSEAEATCSKKWLNSFGGTWGWGLWNRQELCLNFQTLPSCSTIFGCILRVYSKMGPY